MIYIIRLKGYFEYFSTVSGVRHFCVRLCDDDTEIKKLDSFLLSDSVPFVCEFMYFTIIKRPDVYFPADVK